MITIPGADEIAVFVGMTAIGVGCWLLGNWMDKRAAERERKEWLRKNWRRG